MKRSAKSCIRIFSADAAPAPLLAAPVAALMAGLMLCSLFVGAVRIPPAEVLAWVTGGALPARSRLLLSVLRWPRTLACALCGAALAVSGALLQNALGNPLAGPSTIGVNAGAGLWFVLGALLFPHVPAVRSAAVLPGAMGNACLVMLISRRAGASRLTIVLAGVALSAFSTAVIDAIVTWRPDILVDRAAFSIGGFAGIAAMDSVFFALPCLCAGFAGAVLLAGRLDILRLGDEVAFSLGLPARAVRLSAVLCGAALAAGAVSICGMIGFVGLIVPHIVRRALRGRNASAKTLPLIAVAAFAGAALVLLCDLLARTLFAPYEAPVGILLSFLGAPFFLYLLMSGKRSRVLS
ncbi:MAG: iron ABC transporter permease [Clostridiales Family XIII bacterium]|jgi:iron complex transport system permease protein|nr:iron ABC transporter permease [Clostridiales Family XIII bacterium]